MNFLSLDREIERRWRDISDDHAPARRHPLSLSPHVAVGCTRVCASGPYLRLCCVQETSAVEP
jgi:hypothetical protein